MRLPTASATVTSLAPLARNTAKLTTTGTAPFRRAKSRGSSYAVLDGGEVGQADLAPAGQHQAGGGQGFGRLRAPARVRMACSWLPTVAAAAGQVGAGGAELACSRRRR